MSSLPNHRRRRAYSVFVQKILAVAGLLAVFGCDGSQRAITVDNLDRGPVHLLASEVRAAGDPDSLVDAVFVLSNNGSDPVDVTLTSVGCNCHRLLTGDEDLRRGESFRVDAGAQRTVRFDVRPSDRLGEQHYRAEFTAVSDSGAEYLLPIVCRVRTHADVSFRPDMITRRITNSEGVPIPIEFNVIRTYRAERAEKLAPVCRDVPDSLTPGVVTLVGEPEAIAPGLWRETWRLEATIVAPQGISTDAVRSSLAVSFSEDAESFAEARCSILLRREFGVIAPESVHFGRVSAGETRERRVILRAADGRDFRVSRIESPSESFTGRVVSEDAGPVQVIDVVFAAAEESPRETIVECATDHSESPTVRIAVRAIIE